MEPEVAVLPWAANAYSVSQSESSLPECARVESATSDDSRQRRLLHALEEAPPMRAAAEMDPHVEIGDEKKPSQRDTGSVDQGEQGEPTLAYVAI